MTISRNMFRIAPDNADHTLWMIAFKTPAGWLVVTFEDTEAEAEAWVEATIRRELNAAAQTGNG